MTNKQFKELPRYPNGRLIDLPAVFLELTEKQVEQLHSDDWSYYNELQEEVHCMMMEVEVLK